MSNKGLLFIPDISGFSRFINSTEIEHSRLIIQELLEIIINANESGLEISEIEGDAVLFYRFGEMPSLETLYKQVERMFVEFHQSLIAYDHLKYCQCKACTSVLSLTLKVITHYGEFAGYQVRNFNKLIGKDLIVAHQLLKNDIEEHEYWLITDGMLPDQTSMNFSPDLKWSSSNKMTESGKIDFHYAQLGNLKVDIATRVPVAFDPSNKELLFTLTSDHDTNVITLFHATGDFRYRPRWFDGLERVEELGHFLPRVGMKCKCVLTNGESYVYSSSYHFAEDVIQFSENDERGFTAHFTLSALSDHASRAILRFYSSGATPPDLLTSWMIDSLKTRWSRSLSNLQQFSRTLEISGSRLPC